MKHFDLQEYLKNPAGNLSRETVEARESFALTDLTVILWWDLYVSAIVTKCVPIQKMGRDIHREKINTICSLLQRRKQDG